MRSVNHNPFLKNDLKLAPNKRAIAEIESANKPMTIIINAMMMMFTIISIIVTIK